LEKDGKMRESQREKKQKRQEGKREGAERNE